MSRCTMMAMIIVVLALVGGHQSDAAHHCQSHRFGKSINSTVMQFTKEAVSQEYAVLGEFKNLHCCAKNYRNIEWFKNGKPYPWARDTSSLILYPEAENQTIYTLVASSVDVGNYTCVLRNDTHKSEHHIELNVQGTLPDIPMATFKPTDQFVQLNEPARLYCEAFVGKSKLPDARSSISWFQVFEGQQEHEVDGTQEIVEREDGQIIGSYLLIGNMQPHNYGRYMCRIDIGSEAHRLEMFAWIFGTPIAAEDTIFVQNPLLLALGAAIITIALLLIGKYTIAWYSFRQKRELNQCQAAAAHEKIRIRAV